jgi:putative nucleotidyltransferase with HDIG domain
MDLTKIIDYLLSLENKKDPPENHPEDNLLSHLTQAFQIAKKESTDQELWVAALLHDIGKAIQNPDHPEVGVQLLKEHGYINDKVLSLVNNHMRIRWFLSGRMKKQGKIEKILNDVYLVELIHLRRIDKTSRIPNVPISLDTDEVMHLLTKTNQA